MVSNLSFSPGRILVINVARIGDTILATPAIAGLKNAFPNACLDVMAHPNRKCVLDNNFDINGLFSYNFWNHRWHLLMKKKIYDIVFIYGQDARLLKYGRVVGKYTVGFRQKDSALNSLLDVSVIPSQTQLHAIDDRLQLVKAVGVSNVERKLRYCVSEAEKKWAQTFMDDNGLLNGAVNIGFQVASFPAKSYRDWPTEHFVTLGKNILKRIKAKIILFGSRRDVKKARLIQSSIGENTFLAAGKTHFRQSAALISKCSAFISPDTGPMHIAFALDVPTVALFHCMHPGRYLGPACTELHKVIQMEPPDGKVCARTLGMESISPDVVYNNLKTILDKIDGKI